jgi:hypothetical protein
MPYLDGTGPMDLGPLTGRGLGYCGAGLGLGCGRRMRRGRCSSFLDCFVLPHPEDKFRR